MLTVRYRNATPVFATTRFCAANYRYMRLFDNHDRGVAKRVGEKGNLFGNYSILIRFVSKPLFDKTVWEPLHGRCKHWSSSFIRTRVPYRTIKTPILGKMLYLLWLSERFPWVSYCLASKIYPQLLAKASTYHQISPPRQRAAS